MKVFGYICAVLLCVLVGFAGSLALMTGVQAESVEGRAPLYWIKAQLVNDYMQYHGRNIKSYCLNTSNWTQVDSVPDDRRFIITDFICETYLQLGTNGTTANKYRSTNNSNYSPVATLNSGVVFEPGEEIWMLTGGGGATISGYYVDMPQP